MAISHEQLVTRKYHDPVTGKTIEVGLPLRDAILFELLQQIALGVKHG